MRIHTSKINCRVLFLEPFYGGSHKAFADGFIAHSRHLMELLEMPARFWKWRMRGAAMHFIKKAKTLEQYDLVIMSGLMSAADFKALAGSGCPPVVVYFHENQFSYPLSEGESMDYQFGFTDITSALTADRILFNSKTHMEMFFKQMHRFIRKMPDFRPSWVTGALRKKGFVCYPGCDIASLSWHPEPKKEPPLIIWNHRWEHDKNPEAFFKAIKEVQNRGIDFTIAVLGETFEKRPFVFDAAREQFGTRIVAFGYEPDRNKYIRWLKQGAVVLSTAYQENFGISIVEAAACGCLPLVPDRLSYPEIIPSSFHETCIYRSHEQLVEKLSWLLDNGTALHQKRERLSAEMVNRYAWKNRIDEFDRHISDTALLRPLKENRPPAKRL